MNGLDQAIRRARQDTDWYTARFRAIGIGSPTGSVKRLYETSRMAIRQIAEGGPVWNNLRPLRVVGENLRSGMHLLAQEELLGAAAYGAASAAAQLGFYGEQVDADSGEDTRRMVYAASAAVLALVVAQVAVVNALALTGGNDELLGGSDDRPGPLRDSEASALLGRWLVAAAAAGFTAVLRKRPEYEQMAVALIDMHTTECCLHVHGQVRPPGQLFHTAYPPAFADYQEAPPFHRYCRTSLAVYHKRDDHGQRDALAQEVEVAAMVRSGNRFGS